MGKKHTYPDSEQFWSDKNVCITGGDGFLGSFVQKTLDERGAKITQEKLMISKLMNMTLQI